MTGTKGSAETGFGGVGDIIVRSLRRHPERIAFARGDRLATYAEAAAAIGRAIGLFDELGLRPGDVVLQAAGNRPEQWYVQAACYLAGLRSAAAPVPCDPGALAELAGTLGARLVLLDEPERRAPPARPPARTWFCHDPAPGWRHFWGEAARPAPLECRAGPDDPVRVALTSGTTGPRKHVLLSGRALAAAGVLNLAEGGWPARARLLLAEPLGGGFGTMVVPALARGGTVILPEGGDGFEAGAFVEAARRHRPTLAYLMPPSLAALVADPRAAAVDWPGLELLAYSGAALPGPVLRAALGLFGPVLAQVYGQTECPKALAVLSPDEHAALPEAGDETLVGVPYAGMRAVLLAPDGTPCPPGASGELCVRGPAVMSGYLGDPEGTARASRDGWHHTGDVCRFDGRGRLHLIGRVEDALVRGGETVHPAEVERALAAHREVGRAGVLALPGAGVVALARAGGGLTAARLREIVADAALPVDRVGLVPDIPLAWIGRVDRRALRELASDVRTVAVR
ncbi:fatty-acyl-CoA synthase [Thermocatellispora tengchongensis]|uniref:Fatty-acyl-CoA synthase n=1 Tax=Thermocatellispora tengchongensis TaxID=1073253 RepID=A0A840P6Y4_9ACTN|nr:AMP-binding protein [Thermocatellispora tengchongensis]MBB5133621.1 fatty-acyl-CoA synthase [Thermocatellispora tengchongensis]